jgi:acyl-coenzyme A thioesterase PaaI-like protein
MEHRHLGDSLAYSDCFGCGADNPKGLGLALRLDGEVLRSEFTASSEHQGWPGIMHGGVVSALLYEVLENVAYFQGKTTMMKSMSTDYRRPGPIGKELALTARITGQSGRKLNTSATLSEGDLTIAEGKAELVEVSEKRITG